MTRIEALITPSVMLWARKRSGLSIEEAMGTYYKSPCVKKLHELTEKICKEKIKGFG